jgi:hypothetical protein
MLSVGTAPFPKYNQPSILVSLAGVLAGQFSLNLSLHQVMRRVVF